MDMNSILIVFGVVIDMFAAPMSVLLGVVVAAAGIRWIIRVFMR